MKKFTFLLMLAATLFAVLPLHAEGVMYGIKGGLNISDITGNDAQYLWSKSKMGVVGGVFMCYNFSDVIAIQPELLFSMKGAQSNIPLIDISAKLNYFEIPVLLKLNLPTAGKIKPNLYAGPALGILISAKAETSGISADIKNYLNSMDLGIVFGGGVGYQLEKGLMFIEARYELGMMKIPKKETTGSTLEEGDGESSTSTTTTQIDIKNSAFSVMVGYGFGF